MPVYNVSVPVVACVEAPDVDTAVKLLRDSLTHAGYSVYDYGGSEPDELRPYEDVVGTEVFGLPE